MRRRSTIGRSPWPCVPTATTTGITTTITGITTTITGITTTAELAVDATWDGGYRCRVKARDFEIRADEPVKSGGEDTGPQPTELFLASIASCFTLALAHVARKRKIELADIAVRVVGTYDGPKFVHVRVEVSSSHPREELEMLAERASSVCYVSNTIRALHDTEVVIT